MITISGMDEQVQREILLSGHGMATAICGVVLPIGAGEARAVGAGAARGRTRARSIQLGHAAARRLAEAIMKKKDSSVGGYCVQKIL